MVTKVVHYRKFDPVSEDWSYGTLQALLETCLNARASSGKTFQDDWEARKIKAPGAENLIRFMHNIHVAKESIFGTLCLFLPDDWAVVMRIYEEQVAAEHKTLDEVLQQLEIAERPPAEGEDYLRGISYWLVVNNNLFVVQHTSIQTKAFEEYLSALLLSSGALPPNVKIGLRSEFNRDLVGGDLENITAVEIGGVVHREAPLLGVEAEAKSVDVEEQKVLGRRVSRFEKAAAVLSAVFGELNAQSIISGLPPEAELEVDVRFGYKTTRRDVSRATLRTIARAARNLPDGEVVAFGRDGKQVGDDLRLSMPMPFRPVRPHGALLDLEDARIQLLRVYQRFLEDNKIES